jgi:hypothetical protein
MFTAKYLKFSKLPIEEGILPDKLFELKFKVSIFVKLPILEGSEPCILLA